MKTIRKYSLRGILAAFALLCWHLQLIGQTQKVQNQPYADQKMYHIGFSVGLCSEDLILKHTGAVTSSGETWFAEIPSYSMGFTVGFIADRYLNEYFNLRVLPTLYFGEKNYVFKEQTSLNEYSTTIRNNYLSLPVLLKFNAQRINNYRPFVMGGAYVSSELGGVKNQAVRLKNFDYGLQLGIGCNFYLPLFKFCPELRFSFGLRDLIDKERKDLTDTDLQKYTDALDSGKSRMISLILNFE
ncbi:MAG: hypothetical protein H6Q14_2407 [Bacteroidetes bacterium]|nr:hypothetical protein [Bacteroidota bacterium]